LIPSSGVDGGPVGSVATLREAFRIKRHLGFCTQRCKTASSAIVRRANPFYGASEMKTLRIMAASAVVLVFGHAQAQDATVAPQPSPVSPESATLSVGGVSDASRSDAGSPIGKTRQQVYQEYLRARQSGEMDRIQSLYGGQ
jgi:hypothetical protein